MSQTRAVVSGSLLVAGTCVGAAALSLPLGLLSLGSWGALLGLMGVACAMWYAGALVYEANTYFVPGTNLTTMTAQTLGEGAKYAVMLVFMGLMYALLAAYMTGGGALTSMLVTKWGHPAQNDLIYPLGWMCFGLVILIGRFGWLERVNRLFMVLLVLSYLGFVGIGSAHVTWHNVLSLPAHPDTQAWTLLLTAFGFQVVVPSLRQHLGDRPRTLLLAMAGGVVMTWVLYVIWCAVVYGLLPYHGQDGLLALHHQNNAALHLSQALTLRSGQSSIAVLMDVFLLSAIVTSFVGIALSLRDFIADVLVGFACARSALGLSMLTMLPPFFFAWWVPNGFAVALRYAGICVACINVLLPCILVWKLRQNPAEAPHFRLPGGAWPVLMVAIFGCFVLLMGIV